MRVRTGVLAVLPASMFIAVATAVGAPLNRTEVVVRVHDTSGQTEADRAAALRIARELLAVTETTVTWRICGQNDDVGRDICSSAVEPGQLIVRIMPAPRSVRLSSTAALGHALIGAVSGTGVLATVYSDRVARKAAQARVAEANLLGRAIAHELGHLLLGQIGHSTGGLMRAEWTKEELRITRASDWMFSAGEIASIQRRLLSAPR